MSELIHKGTVTIETDRLILRKFVPEDAQVVYDNWMSDEEVARFFNYEPHTSIEQTVKHVARWVSDDNNIVNYNWAIALKAINEPIGTISFHNLSDRNLRTEVSCIIGKQFWNHGIATEALSALIRFAFFELGLNRIEARHLTANPASGRVLQKAGMKYEGCARQRMLCRGTFYDSAVYAIIKSDLLQEENQVRNN